MIIVATRGLDLDKRSSLQNGAEVELVRSIQDQMPGIMLHFARLLLLEGISGVRIIVS